MCSTPAATSSCWSTKPTAARKATSQPAPGGTDALHAEDDVLRSDDVQHAGEPPSEDDVLIHGDRDGASLLASDRDADGAETVIPVMRLKYPPFSFLNSPLLFKKGGKNVLEKEYFLNFKN